MDTTVDYGGLKLKNPLIVASGGISGEIDFLRRAEENNAAAVVMKTLFEEEYTRKNPAPCFKVIRRKAGHQSSTTFYTFEQASSFDLYRYAEEVRKASLALSIPLIASINCVNEESWVEYARLLEESGASAIELNRSCPYSTLATTGKEMWTSLASETIKLVKDSVSIPLFIKLTPQLSDPCGSALALEKAGANGLVFFSRFTGLEIDLDTESPVMHGGLAGHGGLWSIHYALRWMAESYPRLKVSLGGSGGVGSGDDVIKYILAGATAVQVCTAVYMEGFNVFPEYLRRLKEYMKEKEYESPADFRGKVCNRVIETSLVKRGGEARAVLMSERCNVCGHCEKVCLYGAIDFEDGKYLINEQCAGCGLCEQICPRRAIDIV